MELGWDLRDSTPSCFCSADSCFRSSPISEYFCLPSTRRDRRPCAAAARRAPTSGRRAHPLAFRAASRSSMRRNPVCLALFRSVSTSRRQATSRLSSDLARSASALESASPCFATCAALVACAHRKTWSEPRARPAQTGQRGPTGATVAGGLPQLQAESPPQAWTGHLLAGPR